ncbi:MAG: CDP-alcohol phosphatidyltransferase family protein [Lentisphaeria bacterium]|nr:CDP-alcohol phosphatidyltransferase family protein [Candidatus Neomarinimicrobiota bacterium]MCF7842177.1 CDP-alcohol phosphatidyltransferase family protein [Lentisphaeria bacterium]
MANLKQYITIPNAISLARAFMAIPIVLSLNKWDMSTTRIPTAATIWIALAILSDFFDGWFARSYKEVTRIGKMLDPIADKVVIFASFLFATPINTTVPLWFILFIIGRDATISLIGLWVTKDSKRELQANRTGKWSLAFTASTIILFIFQVYPWAYYVLGATVLLNSISWIFYLRLYYIYFVVDVKRDSAA